MYRENPEEQDDRQYYDCYLDRNGSPLEEEKRREMKTPLQLVAGCIWFLSEILNLPLGRFAPIVFGWMIGSKGKKLK